MQHKKHHYINSESSNHEVNCTGHFGRFSNAVLTIGIQQKNWFGLWLEQHFQIEVTVV
jgi:hypothetical protein